MKTARDFLLAARRCEIRDLEKLAQSCALVLAVGELVHGLQRERGSSQIFLVSGGQRFGPELEACIRCSRLPCNPPSASVFPVAASGSA